MIATRANFLPVISQAKNVDTRHVNVSAEECAAQSSKWLGSVAFESTLLALCDKSIYSLAKISFPLFCAFLDESGLTGYSSPSTFRPVAEIICGVH